MGLYTSFSAAGSVLPFVPSPAELYRNGRAIDRVRRRDGTFSPLTDDGAEPNQVMRAVQAIGIKAISAPTTDGRYSDAETGTINVEPTLGNIETERLVIPVAERAIISVADGADIAEVVGGLRRALAGGFAVGFGIYVDTAFEDWSPQKGPMGPCDPRDPNGGGHWMCMLGYYTQPTGATVFQWRNSWGRDWGLNGDIDATEALVAQGEDFTVFVPQLQKAA